MRWLRRYYSVWAAILVAAPAFAGFPSTETFLPAVGRVPGQGGAQFYTTVWATNLSGATVHFTFDFLKQGQANSSPASFTDSLAPGQTKVYENVVESKLGLASAIGAARVVSDGEILVSERIYDQAPGADVGNTEGLFFAGVPKTFSISAGQSASIQGINQGGAENFRYNFALVETGGGSPTVNVQLFDGSGTLLGQKAYVMQPYEQIQPNVTDITASVHTTNARITATITGGTGSVLLAGAQLANESQDSSGFEMSFRDDLLGGGTAGVTSLNGLTGALTIAPGNGISVTKSGASISIAYTGGGSSGITSVTHDGTLAGAGTGASPLGIAPGGVGTTQLNGAGSTAGQVLTSTGAGVSWQTPSSGGGGGGLAAVTHDASLTGSGTGALPLGVASPLSISSTAGDAITGTYSSGAGSNAGVTGTSTSPAGFGVHGHGIPKNTDGYLGGNDYGVLGIATDGSGIGVYGKSSGSYAVRGDGPSGVAGVYGQTSGSFGAVQGHNTTSSNDGYMGGPDYGVFGNSSVSPGVIGRTNGSSGGIRGEATLASGWGALGKNTTDNNATGYLGGNGVGVEGDNSASGGEGVFGNDTSSGFTGAGVYGVSTNGSALWGACGSSNCVGVYGVAVGTGYAGIFTGKTSVNGDLAVNGNVSKSSGSFKIDHPLDPAHKYLYHSFVESPDMKNVYDGIATLDASGVVTVALPGWFSALNRDFRYQLTALGTPQPALFVAKEMANNQFTIAGGVPGARVSWQVTGIRQDAWANAHRIPVEQTKPDDEQDTYLHPELFGEPMTKSFDRRTRETAFAAESAETH